MEENLIPTNQIGAWGGPPEVAPAPLYRRRSTWASRGPETCKEMDAILEQFAAEYDADPTWVIVPR